MSETERDEGGARRQSLPTRRPACPKARRADFADLASARCLRARADRAALATLYRRRRRLRAFLADRLFRGYLGMAGSDRRRAARRQPRRSARSRSRPPRASHGVARRVPGSPSPALAGVVVVLRGSRGAERAFGRRRALSTPERSTFSVCLLRDSPDIGAAGDCLAVRLVWGTDIFAYFGGRMIGGPKLWPRVSAGKTWSGTIIGVLSGALLGLASSISAPARNQRACAVLFLVGLVAAALAQVGDLFESSVKRRFGVKDSSQIIPGHGGVMDRLDGFIFASALRGLLGRCCAARRRWPPAFSSGRRESWALAIDRSGADLAAPPALARAASFCSAPPAPSAVRRSTFSSAIRKAFSVAAVAGGARLSRRWRASRCAVRREIRGDPRRERLCGAQGGAGRDQHSGRRRSRSRDRGRAARRRSRGLAPLSAPPASSRPTPRSTAGRDVALANKECLVCAGVPFMRTAARGRGEAPADGQRAQRHFPGAWAARTPSTIERMIITASGGPFRTWTKEAHRTTRRVERGAQPSQLVDGTEDHDRFAPA